MAKAKAKNDSGKKKANAAKTKAKAKASGKKKAAAEPKADVAAQDVTAAASTKAKKAGKKKAAPKAAAAEAAPKAEKKAGKKKAAPKAAAAEAAPKAEKKASKKKAAAEATPKAEKKASKKKAAPKPAVAEAAPKAEKKASKKKAATAEAAPKAEKKAGKKKAATAEAAPKAEKKGSKKKAAVAGAEKKAGKKKAAKPQTEAERSDRHRLYQLSVQSPEADLEFFTARYEELRGRVPKVLREDFCGTAFLSATWAASMPDRRAVGIDLDGPTLQWGRENNLAAIPKAARGRVDLRQANVLDGGGERADVTCAMNFSYGVFKTRAELRRYFEVVYEQLADEGIFITELYGGVEAVIQVEDEREIEDPDGKTPDFTYVWEQAEYNPITHDTLCHIHFQLGDGSRIERAFTYDWRLWTIPELRELLYEAGFTSVRVYWEATDEDGDGTGEYYATEKEDNQESWLVYLVAAK